MAKKSSKKKKTSKKATTKSSSTKAKSSKKTTKPKTKKKETKTLASAMSETSSSASTTSKKTSEMIMIPKSIFTVVVGVLLALVIAGAYFGYKWFAVATVGGEPISRLAFYEKLVEQGGEQTLDQMISEKLIENAAEREGITVSEEEIDEEIALAREELSAQGQELEQILEFQGLTIESLRDQIRIQKKIAQLAGVQDEVSEEELAAYIEENRDMYSEDFTDEEVRGFAEQDILSQGNQEKIQEFLENERAAANIQYNISL